ncbi:MAG: cytochrome ubiquinol oxidase subunit I [Chloroflexi bacterium CFX4]|nr:cytochrome ubiquinol oxidase subunit I [Chloroflexi bacterium CFX4]MDL1924377.1 cytochrome ubiquinol oxidase subunit I [Chloroflexi bacterium CFX3]
MDALSLARLQFAVTTVYHFFFVPLTIGLSILVAVMQTIYYRTGNELYKRMAKFWGKLFIINFALGVVTGIVQEFQFGMNWSEYARFTGDIFGAPLAIEALLAFFIESTFLGVWIFGWDRLKKGVHLASIWLVALASNISALWILIANSFMQEPVGYALKTVTLPDGSETQRVVMTDFFALLTNPNVWVQFPHVFFAGLLTAAFFMMGISGWHLWRRTKNHEFFMRSFHIGVVVAAVAGIMVALNGHSQAQHMIKSQPMKMAAAEALWDSEDPASFSIFTIGDEPGRRDVFAIRIPALLSILAYNVPDGEVKGINQLQKEYEEKYGPGDYVPPVAFTYWTFRAMVGGGVLMIVIAWFALFRVMQQRLEHTRWLLRILPYAIVLPYASNTSGWLMTEVGRQPWIVFGLQQTADAVSPNVTAEMVLLSLVLFTTIYGVLMAVDIFLLNKFAKDETQLEGGILPEPSSEPEVAVSF